jgi:hypothetical protein
LGLRDSRQCVFWSLREDQGVSIDLEFMTQQSQGVSARIRESPGHGVNQGVNPGRCGRRPVDLFVAAGHSPLSGASTATATFKALAHGFLDSELQDLGSRGTYLRRAQCRTYARGERRSRA